MAEELVSSRSERELSTALDLYPGNFSKFPNTVLDLVIPTVPLWGSQQSQNLLFDSVTGAGGIVDVELTPTPEGQVRYPVAVEVSHNDPAVTVRFTLSLRWDRAGVTTSVAIRDSIQALDQFFAMTVENLQRLYLQPTARFAATASGGTSNITLKMAYYEFPLGENAPP